MGFKWYKQKIQWVFPVWNEEGEAAGIARVISILKVLGVRNITEINFMEKNFKRVNTCSGYVQYPESIAVKKAAIHKKICEGTSGDRMDRNFKEIRGLHEYFSNIRLLER